MRKQKRCCNASSKNCVTESLDSHPLGALISQLEDDQGSVCIRQLGQHRFLTFGNNVEQSCCNTARPHRLEHAYTQAMMLGLLLQPATHSALILGLGGGSLVRALRQALPAIELTAVESRQTVLDAARDWFHLGNRDPLLHLVCDDAGKFLERGDEHFDLILADLYLEDGINPVQNSRDFLTLCREQLSSQGILLLNHWCSEFRDSQLARERLHEVFGEQLLYLHVQGGNVIAFAFHGHLPVLERKTFFEAAQMFGLLLDIPLNRLARNFWRQNSEPLKLGRFRR